VTPSGSLKLKSVVQPHLEKLSDETGETANLMIRVGNNIRFLSTVESRNALRVGDRRGAVLPASRASGGKALLAELDLASLRKLFRLSEDSADPEFLSLTSELDRVRRQGFATNFGLTEDGVCAVGAALHLRDTSIAAISVSLPALRLENAVRQGLIEAVLRARRGIESDLAEHPNIAVT
jgi:DNA-binding IclR family transcriptional regulator